MKVQVKYTTLFEKQPERLKKKYSSLESDVLQLIVSLEKSPAQGIPLGKKLYKIRLAIDSKGKGKSGGARVITYVLLNKDTVFLTSIYDKSEQDNVSTFILLKILKEEGIIP